MSVAIRGVKCRRACDALAFRIAALSGVLIKVAGAEFADQGDRSRQFVALRFELFDGMLGSGSICMMDSIIY